jgi:transposase
LVGLIFTWVRCKTLEWASITRLRGWRERIRTQKCRRKISLLKVAQISGNPAELWTDARLPDLARQVLQVLAAQIEQLEAAVAAIEKQLMAWHKSKFDDARDLFDEAKPMGHAELY